MKQTRSKNSKIGLFLLTFHKWRIFFCLFEETAMSTGGLPLLNGRVSRELKATVAAKGEAAHLSAIKLVSDFFTVRFASKFSLLISRCSYCISWRNMWIYKEYWFVFQPPCGARNLWDLVLVLRDGDDSLLPASYSKGIMHTKHLVKHKAVSIVHCTFALCISGNLGQEKVLVSKETVGLRWWTTETLT